MIPMFYFLLVLTAVLAATANAVNEEIVLDSNGLEVRTIGSYYIVPRLPITGGGGLSLAPLAGKQCPLYIGQESSVLNMGIPVKFIKQNWFVAPVNEQLKIKMDVNATSCGAESTYWWVSPTITNTDPEIVETFIAAGPPPDNTEGSVSAFFQIENLKNIFIPNSYSIKFCPGGGGGCRSYIGIAKDKNGVRRLVVGSEASTFMFVRAR